MTTTSQRPPDFGRRKRTAPETTATQAPSKRSAHVGLLLMGVAAVGGGAYAMMPSEDCDPAQTVTVAPNQTNVGCAPQRSSSSGSYGIRSSSYDSSLSSSSHVPLFGRSAVDSSSATSGNTSRGGFGAFARSFTSHFSGGG